MPLAEELLNILCCPETRQDVRAMSAEELTALNRWISTGDRHHRDGSPIAAPVEEALITEDGSRCYLILDDIPVMLIDEARKLD